MESANKILLSKLKRKCSKYPIEQSFSGAFSPFLDSMTNHPLFRVSLSFSPKPSNPTYDRVLSSAW